MREATDNDDPTIADGTEIWRRIPVRLGWAVLDHNAEPPRVRPASGAFKDNPRGPVSVFIVAESLGEQAVLRGHENHALVKLTVGLVRACGLGILRDPEGGGPGHALHIGDKNRRIEIDGERRRACEALAKNCEWVASPPPVSDL